MAKTKGRAGKRALAAGRARLRSRQSSAEKTPKSASCKPGPAKAAARKQRAAPLSASARLKQQLKAARLQQQASANEAREALERQTATAEILKVIASSPSDTRPVFEAIAQRANKLIGGHATTVLRVVGDSMHLVAMTPVNDEADAIVRAAFPAPIAGNPLNEMAMRGETSIVADTESETYAHFVIRNITMREMARLRGFRSLLLIPLRRDGATIGVISVTRRTPGAFADHHVQLLRTFADQAVIAIENVRLFNETKEALAHQTATSEVLQTIGSSMANAQPVFERILDITQTLFETKQLAILLAPGDGLLHLAAIRGAGVEAAKPLYPIPIEKTAAAETVKDRRQRYFPDALSGADSPPSLARIAHLVGNFSLLVTPMIWEGLVVGTINITREPNAAFTEKELTLLRTFADQAVIAIENTRLFNEVQQRTRELSQSLDDLRAAQDRLVQTEKLASLGQLTAGIAHEIKNPLNFVNNFSALSAELVDEMTDLFQNTKLDEVSRRKELDEIRELLKSNLEKVVQHGKRADSIVKNMLLHSREGSTERRSAEVNRLVEESLNLAYHGARAEKAGFNITLNRDLDPNAGALDLYPQEMTRALLNLISNGFYAATKRKAEVSDETFDPVLSATTKNLGEAVEIRIRDNGSGIPPEVREKMFNPFFTTKPTGEGTGLGLSMTHDIIVKQHGGRIDVETAPGVFTEFIITLPRGNGNAGGLKSE